MALTRDQLLARTSKRTEVELDGGTVIIRGMTRAEAAEMRKLDEGGAGPLELEAFGLATCLVEPAISIADARVWLANDEASEIQKVIDAIQRQNGQGEGQAKGYTKSVSRRR